MLHPPLDAAKIHQAEFRKSQKKFTATDDMIFSIVDYSKPYTFGRLNNEITILLSSLGVTNDDFVALQQEYFDWVQRASSDPVHAFELFSTLGKHDIAERVLLDGLDSPTIVKQICSAQAAEIQAFHKEGDATKERVRMLIRKSRRLFGVCDPFGVLKEGQVHVRITVSRAGASNINHLDVIVVRNPCLHPGTSCERYARCRGTKLKFLWLSGTKVTSSSSVLSITLNSPTLWTVSYSPQLVKELPLL